jgi:hypothetical protein
MPLKKPKKKAFITHNRFCTTYKKTCVHLNTGFFYLPDMSEMV